MRIGGSLMLAFDTLNAMKLLKESGFEEARA